MPDKQLGADGQRDDGALLRRHRVLTTECIYQFILGGLTGELPDRQIESLRVAQSAQISVPYLTRPGMRAHTSGVMIFQGGG